jgi:MFS family permease
MTTTQIPPPEKRGGIASVLKNRNLRLYFGGQLISMIGTWMQQMALSWLVYRLTNSAYMLGVIGFATMAPSILLTPIAGMVADRTNRHRLVIITQILAMIQAGLLAAITLGGHPQIWQLLALGTFMGIISAFDLPTRQTFLIDMLDDKEEMGNAIAMGSSIMTVTRLIGPAMAGVCIAAVGEGICFLANSVSYVPVIVALCFVKAHQRQMPPSTLSPFGQIKEGFVYAFGFRPLRALILMMALISLFAMPFTVLMPAFAKDVFHGNASTLGILTTASGIGSLFGAIFLASRKGVLGLGKWIGISCAIFGVGLIIFGLSHSIILSSVMLAVVGFGSMVQMAASNTLVQTIVEEDKRGRVMSIFMMAFMGLAPFGSMAAGALANVIGVGNTVTISGVVCIVIAVIFRMRLQVIREDVRPIYVERGILSAESELKVLNQ